MPDAIRTDIRQLRGDYLRHLETSRHGITMLERVVLWQLAGMQIITAWWFGGQSPAARDWLLIWGSVGIVIFFAAFALLSSQYWEIRRSTWRNLWPLVLFNALALSSLYRPMLQSVHRDGTDYLMLLSTRHPWLPVCSRPADAFTQLWLINGIVLSAYNAFLVLHRRRLLRLLLLLTVGNALALAIFGTFQHLAGAKGLYFDVVATPQPYFFSTFVYHNHWAAYMLLVLTACFGLVLHAVRRGGHRDFWHSPALSGGAVTLLLSATIPLSASRSGTALLALLWTGTLVYLLARLIRRRRRHQTSFLAPAAGILACAVLSVAAIAYLGRNVIRQRTDLTRQQMAQWQSENTRTSRYVLYRDTLRMAADQPLFGWGLGSYGDIFRIYNSQVQHLDQVHFIQPYYKEAHSDWLQSGAEVGIVGTLLLVLLGLLPFREAKIGWVPGTVLGGCLAAGCLLILVYAGLEFPLANPCVLLAFWSHLFIAARYNASSPVNSATLND